MRDDFKHLWKVVVVSEWEIKFNSLLGTANIGVHVVHTRRVIITYKLEPSFSLTQKKQTQKSEGTH